jgi:flagellar hook protein FlgE
MLRSMYSGVSGLRSHQTMMDVVGNNIANVNTAGYKSSSTIFQDVLSQTLQGANAPRGAQGGANPAQVGLGVRLGAISTNWAQGAAQLTGRATDLSIQGDGFFAVQQGAETLYTRAGSFTFDANGTLVTPSGASVLGWMAQNGAVNPAEPVRAVKLPIGKTLPGTQTSVVRLGGNLPATTYDANNPVTLSNGLTIYDAQGAPIKLTVRFQQSGDNTWNVTATAPTRDGRREETVGTAALRWDPATSTFSGPGLTVAAAGLADVGTFNGDIVVRLGDDVEPMTQFAGASSLAALEQNGSAMGTLQSFTISPDGIVLGVFSNGVQEPVGQIAMVNFANPSGLSKVGNSTFRASPNSGLAQVGVAGTGGRGILSGGVVEMSNVDLAQEFTNLIVAQRGFQANSRVISATDEILQDLVNLKR